ncbi:DoxX family protein [Micromonospora zhanjiangensis]|uniref:DoxX family protein n=1 Tax=Micromonospora zhanjiangensis TaxID=1522057 RepID=A0ABV8KQB1_9ACTN
MTFTHATPTTTSGRKVNIALWALQVLLAAAFLLAACTKFIAYPDAVEAFDQIGLGVWFMYFIGAVELSGAVGLLVPALSGLAGLGLTALLAGAVVTQILLFDPVTVITPAAYLVPVTLVAWGRRQHTVKLLRRSNREA